MSMTMLLFFKTTIEIVASDTKSAFADWDRSVLAENVDSWHY